MANSKITIMPYALDPQTLAAWWLMGKKSAVTKAIGENAELLIKTCTFLEEPDYRELARCLQDKHKFKKINSSNKNCP